MFGGINATSIFFRFNNLDKMGMSGPRDVVGEDIYEDGLDALQMDGSLRGGVIILPEEYLAVLWKKIFRVQFTDGGWRNRENQQLEHPFAYADAEVRIDTSMKYPKFTSNKTHEKMQSPKEHFDPVPQFYSDMIYLVQLYTGDDDYSKSDLMNDLSLFENMDFDIAKEENCSKCNRDIY